MRALHLSSVGPGGCLGARTKAWRDLLLSWNIAGSCGGSGLQARAGATAAWPGTSASDRLEHRRATSQLHGLGMSPTALCPISLQVPWGSNCPYLKMSCRLNELILEHDENTTWSWHTSASLSGTRHYLVHSSIAIILVTSMHWVRPSLQFPPALSLLLDPSIRSHAGPSIFCLQSP